MPSRRSDHAGQRAHPRDRGPGAVFRRPVRDHGGPAVEAVSKAPERGLQLGDALQEVVQERVEYLAPGSSLVLRFIEGLEWEAIAKQIYTAINDSMDQVDWTGVGWVIGEAFTHTFIDDVAGRPRQKRHVQAQDEPGQGLQANFEPGPQQPPELVPVNFRNKAVDE